MINDNRRNYSAMTSLEDSKLFDFNVMLEKYQLSIKPALIKRLWVNITNLCNQTCIHCHVGGSPARTDYMPRHIIDRCLEALAQNSSCKEIDITGGAPELNPNFDYLVIEARKLGKHVLVRHNITVTFDGNPINGDNKLYLPEFYAMNKVEIIASLPYYSMAAVDNIRGIGVFKKSIDGIRLLNDLGYGKDDSGLFLNLVYNSDGPLTPTDQAKLEADYKKVLATEHGIIFNRLYAVTNMPINRYYQHLQQSGTYQEYMNRLVGAFSADAVQQLVCRSLISVGYDGRIYDCDFNQMLGMQIMEPYATTIFNADFSLLMKRRIRFGAHCFGCTAGGGSN
ncbi:arsenosugar biosynthesis radical SAM (seleno)protein ArsS [Chloroflexota bacterium]